MQNQDLQPYRIVVLVALAIGLGLALLQLDPLRRSALTSATAAEPLASAPAIAPAAPPAPAAGTVVADAAPLQPTEGGGDAGGAGAQPAGAGPEGGQPPGPAAAPTPRRRGGVSCAQRHRIGQVTSRASIHATPGGQAIGTLPTRSIYLDQPVYAWIQDTSPDGRWGRVTVPWTKPVTRSGWVRLDALRQSRTPTMVVADLSDRRVTVYRGCRAVLQVRSAIGRPGSPSPTGRFWVTDRISVPSAQRASFGSFAFGLSTVQPRLPQGWTGGNQMAIHGTGAPGSIGQAASAGCLRVTEDALRRLKPLLNLGTPVVIQQ